MTTLFYDRLDDGQFPELQIPAGQRGIQARLLRPPGDARIGAPRDAVVVLAVFMLDEPPVPDEKTPPTEWQFRFDVPDRDGKLQRRVVVLQPRPLPGDFVERAPQRPPVSSPHIQMLYAGAYWVDVSAWARPEGPWKKGMTVELAYGKASTRLTVP